MAKPKHNKKADRWEASFYATMPNGEKPIRENRRFKTKAEATGWLKAKKAAKETLKKDSSIRKIELFDAAELWLNYLEVKRKRSITTLQEYARKIKLFFCFLPAEITLINQIELRHINDFTNYLLSRGHENSTVNTQINQIKSLFRCMTKEYYLKNPTTGWEPLETDKDKQSFCPTVEQYRLLIENIDPKCRPVCEFVANTGLRKTEVFNLKWSDISPDGKSIGFYGKGRRFRTVGLNQTAQDALEKLRPENLNGDPIFIHLSNSKKLLKPSTLYYHISKAFERITGTDKAGLHCLRHFFGTQLAAADVSALKIKELMGHRNIATTERYYIHLLPKHLAGVTESLKF